LARDAPKEVAPRGLRIAKGSEGTRLAPSGRAGYYTGKGTRPRLTSPLRSGVSEEYSARVPSSHPRRGPRNWTSFVALPVAHVGITGDGVFMSAMRFFYVCTAFSCAVIGIVDHRASEAVTLNQPGYVLSPFAAIPSPSPADIQVAGAGQLYLAMGSDIRRVTANGIVEAWSAAPAISLTLIPAGGAYGAGASPCNCILKMEPNGSYSTLHQDALAWRWIALSPDGTLYAVVSGANVGLYQIDRSTGQPSVVVAGGPGPGGIGFYEDMDFGLDGKLYTLGNLDGTISGWRLFRLDGSQFTPVATPPHGGFDLARGPSGVLYMTTSFDYGSGYPVGELWIIDTASGAASLLASTDTFHFGFTQFTAVGYDPGTDRVYVAESQGQIWEITKAAVLTRAESWGALKARYRGGQVAPPASKN